MTPVFLTDEVVLTIHRDQLELFGGAQGIRDLGLLASALAQPRMTFDREYLHGDRYAMAAAYMFHIIRNHPFVDGNKRTGLIAALVFLGLNGIAVDREQGELYELAIAVAEGRLDKPAMAQALRRLFP